MTDTPKGLTAPEHVERPIYLIRKQGLWYRPNERGYTTSAIQAGRYTLADAMKITYPNGPDGPRDGMEFYHEGTLNDADWQAYAALSAKLEAEQLANGHEKRLRLEVIAMEQAATARAEAAEARAVEMEGNAQAAIAVFESEREARQKAESERDALYADLCTTDARIAELKAEVARLREALSLYSCDDGCNDCPDHERDRVSCGWTAYAALNKDTTP